MLAGSYEELMHKAAEMGLSDFALDLRCSKASKQAGVGLSHALTGKSLMLQLAVCKANTDIEHLAQVH